MPVTIGGLPAAELPLTGLELIELEQDGISVRASSDAFRISIELNQDFLVLNPSTPPLQNERTLATESGVLLLTDGGPQSTATLSIVDGGLENVKLADMDEALVKGRAVGSGTGVPVDLTAAQLSAILATEPSVSASITLTNSNDPDLIDLDVPLLIGSATPDSNLHIEVGPTTIQAKSNQTTASTLNLNTIGGQIIIGQPGSTNATIGIGVIELVGGPGSATFDIVTRGFQTEGPDNNGKGGPHLNRWNLTDLLANDVGYFGYDNTFGWVWSVENRGNNAIIQADDTTDTSRILFEGDPDLGGAGIPGAEINLLRLLSTDSLSLSSVSHAFQIGDTASENLVMDTVSIQARNNGAAEAMTINALGGDLQLGLPGTAANILIDQDAEVTITRTGGTAVARTLAAASGGFEVNNALTGVGFERVLTTSDIVSPTGEIGAIKTADTSRTTDVLAADPELAGFVLEANETYRVQGWLIIRTAGASDDVQFTFSNTGGLDNNYDYSLYNIASPAFSRVFTTLDSTEILSVNTGLEWRVDFVGYIAVGGSQITVDWEWATTTAIENPWVVAEGSWIVFTQMT